MTAADYLPDGPSPTWSELATAAKSCRGCGIWERATQAVFGEGAVPALVMLVGEEPGDVEDRVGKPFVGPAGKLLDRALSEAGIDRDTTYVTNAVKHFKWEARGKRRIHKPPTQYEIRACKPWLQAELLTVRPRLVVALGATAARSLLDAPVKITEARGRILSSSYNIPIAVTVHPSSILRSRDDEARHAALEQFIADLRAAASEVLLTTRPA